MPSASAQYVKLTNDALSDQNIATENALVAWVKYSDPNDPGVTELKIVSTNDTSDIRTINPGMTTNVFPGGLIDNGFALWKSGADPLNSEVRIYNYASDSNTRVDDLAVMDEAQFPQLENGKAIWLNTKTVVFPFPGPIHDMWFWNGTHTTKLAENVTKGCDPLLQDGQVWWRGWDGNDEEIFMFDGKKTARLSDNNYEDKCYSVHDGKAAWPAHDGTDFEMILFDRINVKQLTDNAMEDIDPSFFGGQVAWPQIEAGSDMRLMFYNGSDVSTIFDDPNSVFGVKLENKIALFRTFNPTTNEVTLIHLNITPLTTTFLGSDFIEPQFREGKVAWKDFEDQVGEFIRFFDGSAIATLASAPSGGSTVLVIPQFDGKHVTWVEDSFVIQQCTPPGGTDPFGFVIPHDTLKSYDVATGMTTALAGPAGTNIDFSQFLDDGIVSWIGDDGIALQPDCSLTIDQEAFAYSFDALPDPKTVTPHMIIGNEIRNVTVFSIIQNDGGAEANNVPARVEITSPLGQFTSTQNVNLPVRGAATVNFTTPFNNSAMGGVLISLDFPGAETSKLNNKAGLVSFKGSVADGRGHNLPDANITFSLAGVNYKMHADQNGMFSLITNNPATSGEWLRVTLADRRNFVEVYDWTGSQVNPTFFGKNFTALKFADRVKVFNASNQTELQGPIGFHNAGALASVDDLAWIYYFDKITADFANDILPLNMNFSLPVEIYGYRPGGGPLFYCDTAGGSCNFNAKMSKINSPVARTAFNAPGQPDVQMHEFGHHIHTDSLMFGDNMIGLANHNGIANPTSEPSWTEGFAQFVPIAVKRVILNDPSAHLLKWSGAPAGDSMERNWDVVADEEFAVSSLMWDLLDGTGAGAPDTFGDNVQLTIQQIWSVINKPPIKNMSAVYKAFSSSGIAQLSADTDGDNINNLDEIFIAHKFYNDSNKNNTYDIGEPVGITSWNPMFINREEKGPRPGSFLSFTVINISGNQTFDYEIFVSETNAPPFDILDRAYSLAISNETLINGTLTPFSMPPPDGFTVANITVFVDGMNCGSVKINNTFYWERIANPFQESLISKTFICGAPPSLNIIIPLTHGFNLLSTSLHPDDGSLPGLLNTINGSYDVVYAYNPAAPNPWESFSTNRPAFLNTLTQIDERQGFWINATQNASLEITGTIPASPVFNIKEGWNLIGYPSITPRPPGSVFGNVSGNISSVFGFNATTGQFDVFIPNGNGTLMTVNPGSGYWVNATQNATWIFDGTGFIQL
ncbi:MAG: hypothetical protein HY367_01910 [Candidatus Aenigmarchaeota archaeon]|nr:hypothetical protein [Candidatus Aenigmarchaeota archaeon]